jgi:hypothetical protein
MYVRRLGAPTTAFPNAGVHFDTSPADGAITDSSLPLGWRRQQQINYPDFAVVRSFVFVSFWLLCVAGAVLPGICLVRAWRRRWRGRLGVCPFCGYDLRATPDRCPECGAVSQGGPRLDERATGARA